MAQQNLTTLADPDDMFADTRMSFGDHIEDLRSHLLRAIIGFVIAIVVCILPPVGPWAIKFITSPVEAQLNAFYDRYYATQFEKLKNELARKARPIAITMNVHVPTLKAILEGKINNAVADSDRILVGVEDILEQLGFDPILE